jgi:nicotinate phosphoribosyltransferase
MYHIDALYKPSLALFTDLYQLTMAQGYRISGIAEYEAVFHLSFRKNPFKGGYAVACGLNTVIEWLKNFKFTDDDIAYLKELKGNDKKALFDRDFLAWLQNMQFECSVHAISEGTIVFPHEPLIRVQGPLYQCQLIETMLLNAINFETLIATKAARICQATKGDPVIDFGARRAQGIDGALSASRAAHIGGCTATSNVLASKLFEIPVKGTHAHSWVMCFDSELESFDEYMLAMPNNCVFLVDTYNTLTGVNNAIKIGKRLKNRGHKMMGIRLDSGDLAYLSKEARRLLNAAGFQDAAVVASNDLDEHIIESLKMQQAPIDIWGVGTKLLTAYDQPALGGVYKLSALRKSKRHKWKFKVKLSEQIEKTSTPGILQVKRIYIDNKAYADMIYSEENHPDNEFNIIDIFDSTRRKKIQYKEIDDSVDLLMPIFEEGRIVYARIYPSYIREQAKLGLSKFHDGIKRLVNPHTYPVGLEEHLYDKKQKLIMQLRNQ